MIAGEPHCLNFFAQLIIKVLGQCLSNETLPREHPALQLVLRLLNTGLHALQMYTTGEYKEPKISSDVYTRFLTVLMCSMAKELCLEFVDKCPPSESGTVREVQMDDILGKLKPPEDAPWFYCHTYEALAEKLRTQCSMSEQESEVTPNLSLSL
ncbi:unnamed protein product [Soboliphyme baturini]|uniref:Ubiquitin carboxyl-terminal hydrolase 34 n=1 Tax=Soboliphyme baturini TaxID=241478 RepID=A0A183IWI3_9BILA|nr:unnamed protein product [Soboliphyme baturini]